MRLEHRRVRSSRAPCAKWAMTKKQSISAIRKSHPRPGGEVEIEVSTKLEEQVTEVQVAATLARLRRIAAATIPASRVAVAVGTVAERWRNRDHPDRRETVGAIAAAWGWSE